MRFLLFSFLLLLSCGLESGTGGRQVVFSMGVSPAVPQVPGEITNNLGWKISLTEASVSLGPVYFLEKKPALSLFDTLKAFVLPEAHAHAGDQFFSGGRVVGEWIDIETVNLLLPSPQREFGKALGVAGQVRSMSIGFGKQPIRLKGTASRGADTVTFDFESTLGLHPATDRVEFVPVEVLLDDHLPLWVEMHWPRFFEDVQMETLGSPPETLAQTQGYRAIHLNMRRSTSWSLRADPTP